MAWIGDIMVREMDIYVRQSYHASEAWTESIQSIDLTRGLRSATLAGNHQR